MPPRARRLFKRWVTQPRVREPLRETEMDARSLPPTWNVRIIKPESCEGIYGTQNCTAIGISPLGLGRINYPSSQADNNPIRG